MADLNQDGRCTEACHGMAEQPSSPHSLVIEVPIDELRPHPGFAKHGLGHSIPDISSMSNRGEAAFSEPLPITQDKYLLDGYAIWHLAKLQERSMLPCIVLQMTEEDALVHLLLKSYRSNGLNSFLRILVALELEPWFKTKAKTNQRFGGYRKGSLNLTEADRIDVRKEIARTASVSPGSVTKVKHVLSQAIPLVINELRIGGISIHKAFGWSKHPHEGQQHLVANHKNRDMEKSIASLLRKRAVKRGDAYDGLRNLRTGSSYSAAMSVFRSFRSHWRKSSH